MLPILQIGPLALQTPGLILLIGLWIGLSLAERFAAQQNVDANHLYNLTLIALLAGILGSRVAFAARFPEAFLANPASLISLNPGLLDPLGGLVIGALAATIYGQRVKLPLLQTLDALTPTLATLGISLGLAHLAAGTAFGAVSDILWSINLWGANRHPTQIYETIFAAIILWFTWPGRKQAFFYLPGARFFTFLALTAGARLLLEGFRGDSAVLENGIRTAQIFAWVILGASLVILRQLTLNPSMAADGKETSRPPKKSGKKR